jgi:hypothetical protein
MHQFSLCLILAFAVSLYCCMAGGAEEISESPLETTRQAASEAKTNLARLGYVLDGSVKSVREIDRFIKENWDDKSKKPVPGSILAENFGIIMFSLACYVGEVLVNVGGEWHFEEDNPQWGMTATVTMNDGGVCCPAQRLMERLSQDPEDLLKNDLYFYTWSIAKNVTGVTEDDDFIQIPLE